jgi:hypothetical protein
MYLRINPCPVRMQAYENKTLHKLDKTTDGKPLYVSLCVCVCVCVCARARVRNYSNEKWDIAFL